MSHSCSGYEKSGQGSGICRKGGKWGPRRTKSDVLALQLANPRDHLHFYFYS